MPQTGTLLLLIFVVLVALALLVLLQLTRLGYVVRASIQDRPRRRMFLASVSFFATFLGARILVWLIARHIGPFQWVVVGGRHIHHLVWGILILLVVGYGWLMDVGRAHSPQSIFLSRLMAIGYGAGAALTLDEFAMWLNLEDVYWARQGRLSIDAVVLFGTLLAIGAWGAPFFRAVKRMWGRRGFFRPRLRWKHPAGSGAARPTRRAPWLRRRRARRSGGHSAP